MEIALTLGLQDATGVGAATWRLTALALGALLAGTRAERWLQGSVVAAALLLLLVMFTPLVERPAQSLLRADPQGDAVPAVVVFSGSLTDAGDIGDIALTRLVSALEDARQLGIPHLVISVQERRVDGRLVSTAPDQRRLVALLGAGLTLHEVSGVSNTHNESQAFAGLARSRGWTHVRAVTSPLHTTRACGSLEAAGLSVTCAPATSRNVSYLRLRSAQARLRACRAMLHEVIGLAVYRWRGWL